MLFVPQRQPISNGTILQTQFPPAYIPGPYDPPLPFIGRVPSLVNLCILSLAPFVDQVHQLPMQLRLRTRKALKDFAKPMDPRVWGVLVQMYDAEELPKGMRVLEAALSDVHVPLLQDVLSTERFTLLTVLELGKCRHLTDDTIRKLGVLSSLCAFDASKNELSAYGVKSLAGTLNLETERGPWGLRILSLRGCTRVGDEVYEYLSSFPLLSVIDLRHTQCTYNKSFLSSSSFDPSSDKQLFHPTSLLDSVDLLQSIQPRLQSAPKDKSYILHLNSLHYKPTQAQVAKLEKEKKYKPPPGTVQDSFVVLPRPGSAKGRVMTEHIDTLVKREKMKEEARVHEENKERWYEQNMGSGYGGPRVVEARKRDVQTVPVWKDIDMSTKLKVKQKPKLRPASSTTISTSTASNSVMPSSIYAQARSTLKSRQKCDDAPQLFTDPPPTHLARRMGSTASTSAPKPTSATPPPTPHISAFTSSSATKADAKRRIQPQPQPTSTNTNLAKLKATSKPKAKAKIHPETPVNPTSDNKLHIDISASLPSLDLCPSQARPKQMCDDPPQVLTDPHSAHPARRTGTMALTSPPSSVSHSKSKDASASASAPKPTSATPMPMPTPHISTSTSSSTLTRKAKAKRPIHPLPDSHDRPTSTSTTAAANASTSTASAVHSTSVVVPANDVTRAAAARPPTHCHPRPFSEELTSLMVSEMDGRTTAQVGNKELDPQLRSDPVLASSSLLSASIGPAANSNFTSRNQGRKRKRGQEREQDREISVASSGLISHEGDANTLDVAISACRASGLVKVKVREEEGRGVPKTHWAGDSNRVSEWEPELVSASAADSNSPVCRDEQSPTAKRSRMATLAPTAAGTGTAVKLKLADLNEVDGRAKEGRSVMDQYKKETEDASMGEGDEDEDGTGDEDSAMYDSASSTNLYSYDEYDSDSACGCDFEDGCSCPYDDYWGEDRGGYHSYDDSDEYDSDGNRYERRQPSHYENIRRAMVRSEPYRNQPPSWHFGTGFRVHDLHAGGSPGGTNVKRRHVPEEMMLYRNPMPVEWLDEVREQMRRERGERGTLRDGGKDGEKDARGQVAKVDIGRLRMVGLAGTRGRGADAGVVDRPEGKRRKLDDGTKIGENDNGGDVTLKTEESGMVGDACAGVEEDQSSPLNVSRPISFDMLSGRLSQSAPASAVPATNTSTSVPPTTMLDPKPVQSISKPLPMKTRNPFRKPMSGLGKIQRHGDLFSRFSLPASSVPASVPMSVTRSLSTSSTPSTRSPPNSSSKPASTSSLAQPSFRLPPTSRMEVPSTSSEVLAARKLASASSKPSSRNFSIDRQAQISIFNVSSLKSGLSNSKVDAKMDNNTTAQERKKIVKSLSVPSFMFDERLDSGLGVSGSGSEMTSKHASPSAGEGKAASKRLNKPYMSASHSSSSFSHKGKDKGTIRTTPSELEPSATTGAQTTIDRRTSLNTTQAPRPHTSDHDSQRDEPRSSSSSSHSPKTNVNTKLVPISLISVPVLSEDIRKEVLSRERHDSEVDEIASGGGVVSSGREGVVRKKVKVKHDSHNSSMPKKPRKSGSKGASISASKSKGAFDWKAWSKEGTT